MFPKSETGGWKWGCCGARLGERPCRAGPGQERRLGKSEGAKAGGSVVWPHALAVRCHGRTDTERVRWPSLRSRILVYLAKPGARCNTRGLPSALRHVGSLLAA